MQTEIEKMVEQIITKEFSTSVFGYNKKKVDLFLDEIIDGLEEIKVVVEENNNYLEEATKSKLELKTLVLKLQKKIKVLEKNHDLDELVIEKKIRELENGLQEIKKDQNIY